MSSFESMKNKLDSVGIYRIDENSNISRELSAYSEGLDGLFESLDTMTRECFIETAESFGISRREKFLGKEKIGYSTDKRREMLMLQEQNTGKKCTPDNFLNVLRSFGLTDFSLVENPSGFKLNVRINDILAPEQKKVVEDRIMREAPLHLLTTVTFQEQ